MTFTRFVTPSFSSTPIVIIVNDLTLNVSSLPLAQGTELETDEPSGGDVSVIGNYSGSRLKELILVKPYLEEASFKELCGDNVFLRIVPSI